MITEYIASLFDFNAAFPGSPTDDFWYRNVPSGGAFESIYATSDPCTALHVSAFFNGVRIIAETIAQVPLLLYERIDEDNKERAPDNPLFSVLHDQPNRFQSSYEFRLLMATNMLLGGNAYALINGGRRGAVEELIPLIPARMHVVKLPNGRLGYRYHDEEGREISYTQDEIFHVRNFPLTADGVLGQGILTYARNTIGLALGTQSYGTRLYNSDGAIRGVYSVPGPMPKDQIEMTKEQIRASQGLMVLTNGATWVNTGMTAQDAEFLTNRKFEVTEIARWFNMPPHLLKDLDRATFSNIEHQGLEFLQFTMLPYFKNWEMCISRDLIAQSKRFFAEFLVDGLVRADIQTRYAAYATGINSGFMNRNEVRLKENMNSEEGLDKFLVDQNKAIVDDGGNIIPVNKPNNPSFPAPSRNGNGTQPPRQDARAEYANQVLCATAQRMIMLESNAIKKALERQSKPGERKSWTVSFYSEFARKVSRALCVDINTSESFATDQMRRFLTAIEAGAEKTMLADLEQNGKDRLLAFVTQANGIEQAEEIAHRNGVAA